MFEEGQKIETDEFDKLEKKDILQGVFNASSPGEIEILIRPSNKQELAFKLKTSDRPFALIKIGDISGWLKDNLAVRDIQKHCLPHPFERLAKSSIAVMSKLISLFLNRNFFFSKNCPWHFPNSS